MSYWPVSKNGNPDDICVCMKRIDEHPVVDVAVKAFMGKRFKKEMFDFVRATHIYVAVYSYDTYKLPWRGRYTGEIRLTDVNYIRLKQDEHLYAR